MWAISNPSGKLQTVTEGALCILVDKLNRLGFKPLTIKKVFKVLNHSGNSLQFSQHLSLSFRCPNWRKDQTHLTDISFRCNISALVLIFFLIHSWLIFVPLATALYWEFVFEWFSTVMPYFYSNRVFEHSQNTCFTTWAMFRHKDRMNNFIFWSKVM